MLQVLSAVLLWNYTLTRQAHKLPEKARRDFIPTLINGERAIPVFFDVKSYLVLGIDGIGN